VTPAPPPSPASPTPNNTASSTPATLVSIVTQDGGRAQLHGRRAPAHRRLRPGHPVARRRGSGPATSSTTLSPTFGRGAATASSPSSTSHSHRTWAAASSSVCGGSMCPGASSSHAFPARTSHGSSSCRSQVVTTSCLNFCTKEDRHKCTGAAR
jgi:hypothetical protein